MADCGKAAIRTPRISVVMTTYQRGPAVKQAIESILSSEHDSFELIVADQNGESDLAESYKDRRLQVISVERVGASAARNRAAAKARGVLIAFTDDDCSVDPGWLRAIETGFERTPEAGLLLGNVLAAAHDQTEGSIPACHRSLVRVHGEYAAYPEIEVMGASMAIRASEWNRLGGFWEGIGPGRSIRAGEDYDLVVRGMQAGIGVLEYPPAVVIHHGFRTREQSRELVQAYTFGTAFVMGLRVGRQPVVLTKCLVRFWRSFRSGKSTIVRSTKSDGKRRLRSFAAGLAEGIRWAWRRDG